MSTDNFRIKNGKDWKSIHEKIFGSVIPKHYEWTGINDIVSVLNMIGGIANSNHMFFPDSGGLDLEGAKESYEDGCMELLVGISHVIRPKLLIFESIDEEYEWNYFRIETDYLKPSGVYEDVDAEDYSEEVCELSPLNYVDSYHWEQNEYDGEKLPPTARPLVRYFKGSLVIFKKSSIYNNNPSTYDARHNKMSAAEFRQYIADACKYVSSEIEKGENQ